MTVEVYWENGRCWGKGVCVNGERNGYWEYYWSDGDVNDYTGYYLKDKMISDNNEKCYCIIWDKEILNAS